MWTVVGATMVTMAATLGLLGCGLQASGAPVIRDEIYMASTDPAEHTAGMTTRESLALAGVLRAP